MVLIGIDLGWKKLTAHVCRITDSGSEVHTCNAVLIATSDVSEADLLKEVRNFASRIVSHVEELREDSESVIIAYEEPIPSGGHKSYGRICMVLGTILSIIPSDWGYKPVHPRKACVAVCGTASRDAARNKWKDILKEKLYVMQVEKLGSSCVISGAVGDKALEYIEKYKVANDVVDARIAAMALLKSITTGQVI